MKLCSKWRSREVDKKILKLEGNERDNVKIRRVGAMLSDKKSK
jgi:hypothetical protein